jgi:hypothetical protein
MKLAAQTAARSPGAALQGASKHEKQCKINVRRDLRKTLENFFEKRQKKC